MRRFWTAPALLSAIALGGCASMGGGPASALTSAQTVINADNSKYKDYLSILNEYNSKNSDKNDQKEFRNRVILIYMDSIDENYQNYTTKLFNEGIQSGLAFDTGIIGLSTAGVLWKNSADELSSLISAASGVHAAIDKNLYFDRTLPALIATMDASRIKVETEILGKMTLPTSQYPIEGVFRDLRRYQESGLLFRAITDVTGTAADKKQEAEDQRYTDLSFGCDASTDLIKAVDPINRYVLKQRQVLADDHASAADKNAASVKVRAIAAAAQVPLTPNVLDVATNISRMVYTKVCSVDQADALKSKIEDIVQEKL